MDDLNISLLNGQPEYKIHIIFSYMELSIATY